MRMKNSNILGTVVCIVLLVAALGVASVRGWSKERSSALSSIGDQAELTVLAENMGMDAANLCVVAARHLPADDADLTALLAASQVLRSASSGAEALIEADWQAGMTASALIGRLRTLASVQSSIRDQSYLSSFSRIFSGESKIQSVYQEACEAFNSRMGSSLTGRIAMLLGVSPLK